jgi:hypothetical protein
MKFQPQRLAIFCTVFLVYQIARLILFVSTSRRLVELLLFVFYLQSYFLMQFSRCNTSNKKSGSLGAGGDNEIRTRDLLLARQALSQLSYAPIRVPGHRP